LMMSLWDALRMNMMISYQELVRTFPKKEQYLMPPYNHLFLVNYSITEATQSVASVISSRGDEG
ncbi:hypothetical protein RAF58_20280, partial [Klebsiella pneumoniae]